MESQDVKLEAKEKLRKIRDNLDFREINRQIVEYWQDLERVHFKKGRKNNVNLFCSVISNFDERRLTL